MTNRTIDKNRTINKTQRIQQIQRQLARVQRLWESVQERSSRLSWLRLFSFLGVVILGLAAIFLVSFWAFGVAFLLLLLFIILVRLHQQVEATLTRLTIWQQIKSEQMARAQLDWAALPPLSLASQPTANLDHPFEADLDLVGDVSLLRLVDCTESVAASHRLHAWLTTLQPDLATILARQQLVAELIPHVYFRNQLRLHARINAHGADENQKQPQRLHTDGMLVWFAQQQPLAPMRRWLAVLLALAALNLLLLILNQLQVVPLNWLATIPLYIVLLLFASQQHGAVFGKAMALRDSLQPMERIFEQLERFSYHHAPNLKSLCAPFLEPGQRPSSYLHRLQRIASATALQGNPYLALLLNILFPWNFYFAYRLEQHKAALAEHLPKWLEVWFELDALASLANLGWLNPGYTFPKIGQGLEKGAAGAIDSPCFAVQQLGHPLIPDEVKVCNNFSFTRLGEVAILTGSNMAGKSSFLKALGVNLALAYAGGPVNAQAMQTGLFRLFTCIKISDSVTEGVSYFYAEVKRLRSLLDALDTQEQPLPLFFCIDEIFRGTNNRERLLGSRAYVAALVGKVGIGLISTHDLELVKLADELPGIYNYHFRDDLVNDKMHFDYQLHPGPCPTTNALKIMRNAGLPV